MPAGLFLWLGVVAARHVRAVGYTTFGRRVYAIGNNSAGGFLAGINVRLVTVALYMLSGLFAALAGIALVALRRPGRRSAWATPTCSSRSPRS